MIINNELQVLLKMEFINLYIALKRNNRRKIYFKM